MKTVFTLQPIKRLVFKTVKSAKTCCRVLNIHFKDQKPTMMLFGGDGTHCFARKTSRDYEKEKPSPILKKFVRQPQPSTSEPEPKRQKLFHLRHNRVETPLVDTVNQNLIYLLILYTFSLH